MIDRRRDGTARVALVLAAVLLPLAMLSSWSSAILSDDDRYVDAVAPLASDPVVQQAVIDHLTTAVLDLIERNPTPGPCTSAPANQDAQPDPFGGFGEIARSLAPLAEGPIRAIVTGIVRSPSFAQAWVGANRSAHDQLIGVLKGDDRPVDATGCVSIDLSGVLADALPQLNALGSFGIVLPDTKIAVASITADDLHSARLGYSVLNPLGFWLPVLWFLAVVAAFALGRRRLRTLWILGTASAAGMLILLIGLALIRSGLADASGDAEVSRAIWDAVASAIRNGALLGLALSVVAAVGGAVLSVRRDADHPTDVPLAETGETA